MEENSNTPLTNAWNSEAAGKPNSLSRDNDNPSSAKDFARSAEEQAESNESSNDASQLENNPSYRPSGQFRYKGGESGPSNAAAKLKGVGKLKKAAPLAILLGVIVIAGLVIGGLQSLAPFSFLENAKNMFNTTQTGMDMSSRTMVDSTLEGDASSASEGAFDDLEPSDELKACFSKSRIDYLTIGGIKGLAYQSPSSKEWLFVTSNSTNGSGINGQTAASSTGADIIISNVSTLDSAYANDRDFANAFDTSLRRCQLRGHSAGWYNSTAEMYNSQIGNTRDKFYKYEQSPISIEQYNEAVKENGAPVEIGDTSGNAKYESCTKTTDEDGKEVDSCDNEKTIKKDSLKQGMDESAVKDSLSARAKKAMVASSGDKEASKECKVAKAVSATSAAATGVLKIQVLNSGSAFLEAIDKAKVGDGGSAMNAQMQKVSTPGKTLALNDESDWVDVEGKENATGVGSLAWSYVAGGNDKLSSSDPLVKTFTFESFITDNSQSSKLKDTTDYTDDAVNRCSSISQYEGANDLYDNKIGSVPSGGFFESIVDFIAKLFGVNGDEEFVNNQSNQIAEVEAKRTKAYLDMDIENMSGETGMYGIVNGTEAYYQQMQLMVSAQPGTADELYAFWQETQDVIAREAEIDREILSPFDLTSQNTFFGSIAHKTLPVIAKITTPLKAFSNFVGTTISSIQSVIPIAGAASAENAYKQTLRDDCQTFKYLNNADGKMAGNAFCFQKAYQDTSTTKTKIKDVYKDILYGVSEEFRGVENFKGTDSNGNPKINPNGEYATWLVACSVRKSQWGYLNGQATSFIQEQKKGSGAASTAKNAIEGGLESQEIDAIEQEYVGTVYSRDSLDWATGLNCMGGRNNALSKQVALYAQYNTYQNLLETAGNVQQAAQISFLNDYYDNHPYYTDSIEGIIAQYSGLTPDDVELALGYVEYYDYIAHYDPTNLGPAAPVPEAEPLFFESTSVIADTPTDSPVIASVELPDLRNRTLII